MNATRAFVSVGSNIDPHKNIPSALLAIREYCPIVGVSDFYITDPVGPAGQPEFRNGVILVEWNQSARALKFGVLRTVEARLGRKRTEDRYAPRTIDLDIALFGNQTIDERDLTIPDPDVRERPYLPIAILNIDPAAALPETGEPLRNLEILATAPTYRVDESLTRSVKENTHGC